MPKTSFDLKLPACRGTASTWADIPKILRKKFRPEPAVRNGALHQIKSPLISQPGPRRTHRRIAALQNAIQL
jgi:hypothetical protein